jgi:hypothetical protein
MSTSNYGVPALGTSLADDPYANIGLWLSDLHEICEFLYCEEEIGAWADEHPPTVDPDTGISTPAPRYSPPPSSALKDKVFVLQSDTFDSRKAREITYHNFVLGVGKSVRNSLGPDITTMLSHPTLGWKDISTADIVAYETQKYRTLDRVALEALNTQLVIPLDAHKAVEPQLMRFKHTLDRLEEADDRKSQKEAMRLLQAASRSHPTVARAMELFYTTSVLDNTFANLVAHIDRFEPELRTNKRVTLAMPQ